MNFRNQKQTHDIENKLMAVKEKRVGMDKLRIWD